MEVILNFFQFINDLGASVMMPIIITILGLILGAPFGRALRAGLTVGVGFVGLNLVIGLIGTHLGPAVQAMIERYGLTLDAIDIGWPAAAAIAFASSVGTFIIPVGIIVNVVMLVTNTTQTLDVDIWDYWHFAFTGAMIQALTGSFAMGLVAAVLNMVIIMVIADLTAPSLETYNGLPGISLPHGFTGAFVPIAIVFNKILDFIPGINKIKMDMDKVQAKLGLFGEPMIIGTVIGIVVGLIAGYGWDSLLLGINMGAVLVLIPKMAAMLMEGLLPVSDAAQVFIEKHFKNRGKLYIGLDSAVGIGHPVALTCALILVPLSIALAVFLPGNRVLPFADLAVIPYVFVLIIPMVKGDFFRSLVVGFFTMIIMFYCGTDMVDSFVATAKAADPATYGSYTTAFSSICDGSNPLTWAMWKLSNFQWIGIAIIAVIAIGLAIYNRQHIIKQAKEAAAAEEA